MAAGPKTGGCFETKALGGFDDVDFCYSFAETAATDFGPFEVDVVVAVAPEEEAG